MRNINVICDDHLSYLKNAPSRSFDVVYFDPMFEYNINRSVGINYLKSFAKVDNLSEKAIFVAKRVAKNRVILKDHWRSERFERFQFNVKRRRNIIFHYGYIECST